MVETVPDYSEAEAYTENDAPEDEFVPKSKLDGAFTATWLLDQQFPAINYIVDGIIPEGLTMLVAAPKIGKSWLVLGLALANTNGDPAFGCVPTKARPVLYLALEDGPRRLQGRLQTLGVTHIAPGLEFMNDVPKGDILATIREYMDQNMGEDPLVILDTLGKAMPPAFPGESPYDRDYRVVGGLKKLADDNPGSSIIVVHHTRKMDSADFLDAVSGTQGIAGAADTVMVLKRSRQEQEATLQITSRDAAEGEYLLEQSGTGNWVLSGGSRIESARAVQENKASDGVGDRMSEVIAQVNKYPEGVKPKDVATALHLDDVQVRQYLRRATKAGRITSPSRGLYKGVTTVTSVTLLDDPEAESNSSYTSNNPPTGDE